MKKILAAYFMLSLSSAFAADWNEMLGVAPDLSKSECSIFSDKKAASNMIFKFFELRWFDKFQENCNPSILDNVQGGEAKLLKMNVTIGSIINSCYSDSDRVSIFDSVDKDFSCTHKLNSLIPNDVLSDMNLVK